jgi:hypothetical protein
LISAIVFAGIVAAQMQGWLSLPFFAPSKPDNPTSTPTLNPTTRPTTTPKPTTQTTPSPTPTKKPLPMTEPTLFPTISPSPTPTPTPQPTPQPTNISYKYVAFFAYTDPTIDGKWTSKYEWSDVGQFLKTENIIFKDKLTMQTIGSDFRVWDNILIETSDNTTDPTDFWEICIDALGDGGNTPQPDDYKIDIVGHTNATWFRGNGTMWLPLATPSVQSFVWDNTINSSPTNNSAHWIYEVGIERIGLSINPNPYVRIAVYDGHDGGLGLQAWPPKSSANVPHDWAYFDYDMLPI